MRLGGEGLDPSPVATGEFYCSGSPSAPSRLNEGGCCLVAAPRGAAFRIAGALQKGLLETSAAAGQ